MLRIVLALLFWVSALAQSWAVFIDPYRFTVAPLTFTFVGSAATTATSVDISGTGRQAGDLAVFLAAEVNDNGANTPSGFTELDAITSASGPDAAMGMYAKILTGSEGSIGGYTTTSSLNNTVLVFRPSRPITSFTANSKNKQLTTANPTLQTVTAASAATTPVIVLGQMWANAAISPRSTSPAMDEVAGGDTSQYVHYKIYNSSPADHTYDMDDEGSNGIQSLYLTFS